MDALRTGPPLTMGAVGEIRAAAVASMPQGMLAGLMRRNGESRGNLLLRLDEAVMQSVVENERARCKPRIP